MVTTEHHDLILERTLDAPRELVWKAWTDPELLKRWWAPRPYRAAEAEIDLYPGGAFNTRMVGPDDFDQSGTGCFLEVVPGEKLVWTSALGAGFRPQDPTDCGGFPMTAVMMLADSGDGRTLYKAVVMHKSEADRDMHEKMGFHEGWGTCAKQLEEVAQQLRETV